MSFVAEWGHLGNARGIIARYISTRSSEGSFESFGDVAAHSCKQNEFHSMEFAVLLVLDCCTAFNLHAQNHTHFFKFSFRSNFWPKSGCTNWSAYLSLLIEKASSQRKLCLPMRRCRSTATLTGRSSLRRGRVVAFFYRCSQNISNACSDVNLNIQNDSQFCH